MQNLTLSGWSPFRCMCLWYKKQSKYSVQIFFCNSKRKYLFTLPRSLKTEYQKPKVIYCRALLYTQTLWHHATRASTCFMYIQNIFRQLKYTTNPTVLSLLAFTNKPPQCKLVLSLAGPQGVLTNHLVSFSPSHTLTQTYRNTHIHTQGTMNRTLIKH